MIGRLSDLVYDMREVTRVYKEAIEKHVPNAKSYIDCIHPLERGRKVIEYLANLKGEEKEKHKDLLVSILEIIK